MIMLSAVMMTYSVFNHRTVAAIYWAVIGALHTGLLARWRRQQ